jgi:hypothetical protein
MHRRILVCALLSTLAFSPRAAATTVSCRLPSDNIRQVVRQGFGRFRACYELGLLRRGPHLQGRVSTKFVIDRDGTVRIASDAGSDLGDAQTIDCVVDAFKQLQFPAPPNGIITVHYPIVFEPLENEAFDAAVAEMRAGERADGRGHVSVRTRPFVVD